jgi:hypothetical protein
MPLGPNQQTAISNADPAHIARVFSGLAAHWSNGRWLSAGNRYRLDCVKKIDTDVSVGGLGIRQGDLAGYVAASSAIHCVDGWSYVARALEAMLSGDDGAATHLAYYGELRAAMSLLACGGIGIFDDKHFAIHSAKCERVNGSTHVIAWQALEFWGGLHSSTDLILKIIQPGGQPLADWLSHYPLTSGGGFRGILAQQWLLDWGLDLRRIASDKTIRNESSYRPRSFAVGTAVPLSETLDFLARFWTLHEPAAFIPFRELDRQILRKSLAFAFQQTYGMSIRRAPAKYRRAIEPMLHAMMPTAGDWAESEWRSFLNYGTQTSEHSLLVYAATSSNKTSPRSHLEVLSRSILLLRLATGATRELMQTVARADLPKLSFWWDAIGEIRGLWEPGQVPAQFEDLWIDIDSSLTSIDAWQQSGGTSKKQLTDNAPLALKMITTCERIALWGLGV